MDGWAIAADPHTPIGWLAALTAETACVPFVNLARLEAHPQSEGEPAETSAAATSDIGL
jgi:hypothetical protein